MSEFSLIPVDVVAGHVLELEVRNIVYSTYPASKFHRKKVNPTQELRTRRKKDQRSVAKTRLHASHGLLTYSQIRHMF